MGDAMTGIVCDSLAKAQAFSAAINAKVGYPSDGVNIGGGIHASAAEARTLRHADIIAHPTLPQWAYPQDPVEIGAAVALPVNATVQTLDASWFPVVAVGA